MVCPLPSSIEKYKELKLTTMIVIVPTIFALLIEGAYTPKIKEMELNIVEIEGKMISYLL